MKPFLSFLALGIWISSWMPTIFDREAVVVSGVGVLGLLLAWRFNRAVGARRWPARVFSVLAILVLICAPLLAIWMMARETRADGGITLFFAFGVAGYLKVIAGILTPEISTTRFLRGGVLALLLLASWSWASAFSLKTHRGASGNTAGACVLVPSPKLYDVELTSLWDMRLPIIRGIKPPPRRRTLAYHAILVVPSTDEAQVYNWSKKFMRFELRDKTRNPYLPTVCP